MTYAHPAWKLEAGTYFSKLQRLQNKALRTIGNFPGARRSAICTGLSTFRMYTII
jgi:hypothetical protein